MYHRRRRHEHEWTWQTKDENILSVVAQEVMSPDLDNISNVRRNSSLFHRLAPVTDRPEDNSMPLSHLICVAPLSRCLSEYTLPFRCHVNVSFQMTMLWAPVVAICPTCSCTRQTIDNMDCFRDAQEFLSSLSLHVYLTSRHPHDNGTRRRLFRCQQCLLRHSPSSWRPWDWKDNSDAHTESIRSSIRFTMPIDKPPSGDILDVVLHDWIGRLLPKTIMRRGWRLPCDEKDTGNACIISRRARQFYSLWSAVERNRASLHWKDDDDYDRQPSKTKSSAKEIAKKSH